MIDTFLSGVGFQVVLANGGEDAIEAFKKMPRIPDLVLTDVVMPGMSGPMLVDRLLALNPEIRVLFMSGYDERQVVQRYVVEKRFHLIAKPFSFKDLQAAIIAALAD